MKKWFYILTLVVLFAIGYFSNYGVSATSQKNFEKMIAEQQKAIKELQAFNKQTTKSLKTSNLKISKLEKDNKLKQQSIDTLIASNQSVEKGLKEISVKTSKNDNDLTDINAKISKLQNDLSTSIKTTYITTTYTYDDTKLKSDLTANTNSIIELDKKVSLLYKVLRMDNASLQKYFYEDLPNSLKEQVSIEFEGYKFYSQNLPASERVFRLSAYNPYVEDFLMYVTEEQLIAFAKDALKSIADELYSDSYKPNRIVLIYTDLRGDHELEIK